MRAFYRHFVSTAQDYRSNHGDDAMPDGVCEITTGEMVEDRYIGRTPAADGTFPHTNLQAWRADGAARRPMNGPKHAVEWRTNLG